MLQAPPRTKEPQWGCSVMGSDGEVLADGNALRVWLDTHGVVGYAIRYQ
jgi:hypothetical protein